MRFPLPDLTSKRGCGYERSRGNNHSKGRVLWRFASPTGELRPAFRGTTSDLDHHRVLGSIDSLDRAGCLRRFSAFRDRRTPSWAFVILTNRPQNVYDANVTLERDGFYLRLGTRVRDLRVAGGVTQQQLAERVGLTRASIANMERGAQHPSAFQLHQLARAFDVNVANLLADDASERGDAVQDWVTKVLQRG